MFMDYLEATLGKTNSNVVSFRNLINSGDNEKLKNLLEMSANDVAKIRATGGDDFDDFDMFLIMSKRMMTASRVYRNLNPRELEVNLKNLLKDLIKKTNVKATQVILDDNFWNAVKFEDLVELFLDPNKFALKNDDLLHAIDFNKKVFEFVDTAMMVADDVVGGVVGVLQAESDMKQSQTALNEANDNLDVLLKKARKNTTTQKNIINSISPDEALVNEIFAANDVAKLAKKTSLLSKTNFLITAITTA
jgi:hypothetical protein